MGILLRTSLAAALLASGATLSGCVGDYGYGYGDMMVGYGPGYYYDPAWGYPYWGWYGGYYYPGTGYYVYDAYHNRYPWNAAQRGYWEARRGAWRGNPNAVVRGGNWSSFNRPAAPAAPRTGTGAPATRSAPAARGSAPAARAAPPSSGGGHHH